MFLAPPLRRFVGDLLRQRPTASKDARLFEPIEDRIVPAIVTVGASGADHTTIQAALDAALINGDADDTIQIAEGTYTENISIVEDGITLESSGDAANTIINAPTGTVVSITASGVTLDGLTVQASDQRAIKLDANVTDLTLDDVHVEGDGDSSNSDVGLHIGTTIDVDQLTVRNSSFNELNFGFYIAKDVGSGPGGSNVTNVLVEDTVFENNSHKGIYAEKLSNATFTRVTVTGTNLATYDFTAGIDINLKGEESYENLRFDQLTVTNNGIDSTYGVGFTIKARDDGSYAANPASLDNVVITNSIISGNEHGLRFGEFRQLNAGPTNVHVNQNDLSGNVGDAVHQFVAADIDLTGNWWGSIAGPTTATYTVAAAEVDDTQVDDTATRNPGGLGATIVTKSDAGAVDFSPWLTDGIDADPGTPGFQRSAVIQVVGGSNNSLADNDYRRLANAIATATSGQTIELVGTFDWTNPLAAESWANGVDGIDDGAYFGDGDGFTILAAADQDDVTVTAASLGAATILGPGDLTTENLESFLVVTGGGFDGWEISNLEIVEFDMGIYMGYQESTFEDFKILDNHFVLASDTTDDVNQNIAIHLAHGNILVQGNTIDIHGDGVGGSDVGLQGSTHGGANYDGLIIDSNTINVLEAPTIGDPQRIIGIWENGHAHQSNILVTNNQFLNLAPGNDPEDNQQWAFQITSHSSPTTSVVYANNTVVGANVGFNWLDNSRYGDDTGDAFAGQDPIQVYFNTFEEVGTGILIREGGSADLQSNLFTDGNTAVFVSQEGAVTSRDDQIEDFDIGFQLVGASSADLRFTTIFDSGDGVSIDEGSSLVATQNHFHDVTRGVFVNDGTATITNNNLVDFGSVAIVNLTGTTVDAQGNWWGTTSETAIAALVTGDVDTSNFLTAPIDLDELFGGTSSDFQAFSLGSVDGQGGWSVTNPNIDQEIVDVDGNNVIRLSNAFTIGSFGDQLQTPSSGIVAGESQGSLNQDGTVPTTSNRFYAQFDITSATGAAQPGLRTTVSPSNPDHSRMSFVSIDDDGANGYDITFFDYTTADGFRGTTLDLDLPYDEWHEIAFEIIFIDGGPANDIVNLYVNGELVHTGTTWEDYYVDQSGLEQPVWVGPRGVDRLLFRQSGDAVSETAGAGFFLDNVTVTDFGPARLYIEDIAASPPPPTPTVPPVSEPEPEPAPEPEPTIISDDFIVEIEGTEAGAFTQLGVEGTVEIAGANLVVIVDPAYTGVVGDEFEVLTNDGTDPIVGTFVGLAEGASIVVEGLEFEVSYDGGDGNDVTLTVVGQPREVDFSQGIAVTRGNSFLFNTSRLSSYSSDSLLEVQFGFGSDQQFVGDWDGNGTINVGVARIVDGILHWFLNTSEINDFDPSQFTMGLFGIEGDQAIVGDWDGNGRSDIGIHRSSTATWSFDMDGDFAFGPADLNLVYGNPGDTPVVTAVGAEQFAQIGVVRGATWFLNQSSSVSAFDPANFRTPFVYGVGTDSFFMGDWNGDFVSEIGIFRPSVFSLNVNGDTVSSTDFPLGTDGDLPLAGFWFSETTVVNEASFLSSVASSEDLIDSIMEDGDEEPTLF
ncbi:hypothetical protein Pan216_22650 [Planctomycetes bacterium Pan216]|uniref:Periplasmic copper-binding protein NosD beta helix domain-containing protein n=1 Tax=Kolteria novifilia TaxID=2527975 RepID=A0A518B342_9BACT|nr:hypothetical protein Pan216_22650 [Planctomycetes bacterium Pan216]